MGQVLARTAGRPRSRGRVPQRAGQHDRAGSSGLHTIYLADQMIRAGDADIVVAGGMESMTPGAHLPGPGPATASATAPSARRPDGHASTTCAVGHSHRALQPEGQDLPGAPDAFAAPDGGQGRPAGRGDRPAFDEGVRPGTTAETLGALKPAFDKNGTITAGNASQISDGGATVVRGAGGQGQGAGHRPAGPDRQLRPRHRHLAVDPSLTAPSPRRRRTTSTSAPSTSSRSTRPSPAVSTWPTIWDSTRARST